MKGELNEIIHTIQTVLVSCREEVPVMGRVVQKDNIITIDWHMPLSYNPAMYAIAVAKARFSYELIKKSQVFVVNFIPSNLEKEALICGTRSGKHIDKFTEAGFGREESDRIDCPRIVESLAFVDCEVVSEIETGDHVLFIGKVVTYGNRRPGKRLIHTENDKFTTTK